MQVNVAAAFGRGRRGPPEALVGGIHTGERCIQGHPMGGGDVAAEALILEELANGTGEGVIRPSMRPLTGAGGGGHAHSH